MNNDQVTQSTLVFNEDNSSDKMATDIKNIDLNIVESNFVNFLNDRFLREDLKEDTISFSIEKNEIFLNYNGHKARIVYDTHIKGDSNQEESRKIWLNAFLEITNTQMQYIVKYDSLMSDNLIEIPIKILKNKNNKHDYDHETNYEFKDYNYSLNISRASEIFILNFFNSDEYKILWNIHFNKNSLKTYLADNEKKYKRIRLRTLLRGYNLHTIKLKSTKEYLDINKLGKLNEKIESCLYILATNSNTVINLRNLNFKEKVEENLNSLENTVEINDFFIPKVKYDKSLVSFYKAAINSDLPSQKFLDFYHIFEYLFLRVSEEVIYDKVKTYVNHSRFISNPQDIEKLISMIKKHNTENDETEMLKKVFNKYINEDDVIDFISSNKLKTAIDNKKIFGEAFTLSDKQGHAISNLSKILKHVRNALVHSSDRYKREDCHIPFTESEKIITTFIPIMDFLAQKIIAGTATPLD